MYTILSYEINNINYTVVGKKSILEKFISNFKRTGGYSYYKTKKEAIKYFEWLKNEHHPTIHNEPEFVGQKFKYKVL